MRVDARGCWILMHLIGRPQAVRQVTHTEPSDMPKNAVQRPLHAQAWATMHARLSGRCGGTLRAGTRMRMRTAAVGRAMQTRGP